MPLYAPPTTITSSSTNSFNVGQNGATNPALTVNSSAASSVSGISVISAAAGAGTTVQTVSSAGNEPLNINAKGTANVLVNNGKFVVTTNGLAAVGNAATVVAGGDSTAAVIRLTSQSGLGIFVGSGLPTISAYQGSLYLRTDGSSISTRLYVNASTGTGTTWTAVTTAT